MLIANGYAQATQKPTVVQLHCSVGLGNALGSLYHAFRKQRSPLVVIAGEAGVAYDALDAHMALDLVAFARPVTKYAARAIHPGSLLRLLRRCIKIAATPPFGPDLPCRAAGHPRSAQRRAGGADGRSRDTASRRSRRRSRARPSCWPAPRTR